MLHALFLLGFILIAGGLATHVPLAALAGVLLVVAWSMADHHAVLEILRARSTPTAVLAATFVLTVFANLLAGIAAGILLHVALARLRAGGLKA
jgi:SulP family sulfate permease